MADAFGAQLTLMHVVERFPIDTILGQESTRDPVKQLIGEAQVRLRMLAGSLASDGGRSPRLAVRFGKPFDEITRGAKELGASLIVLATHGHSGLKRAFLGSTTERVVRHASCPVLAVRAVETKSSKPTRKTTPIRRIVLATDFSGNSLNAFPIARSLANGFKPALTVLHVVEPFHADMLMDTGNLQRERRRQALEQLRELAAREFTGGAGAKTELRAGHPVEAITRFARESGADLIILATHGRTGLRRALIGSVAERVVRHAPCPVLVVRGKSR